MINTIKKYNDKCKTEELQLFRRMRDDLIKVYEILRRNGRMDVERIYHLGEVSRTRGFLNK